MRTLLVSGAYPPQRAGEADYAWHLARGLAERGAEVEVITSRGADTADSGDIRVHDVMEDWSWREMPRLAKLFKERRPDTVLLSYLGWLYGKHPMINYAPLLAKRVSPGCRFVTLFFNTSGAAASEASLGARLWHFLWSKASRQGKTRFEFGSLLRTSDRLIALSERHRAQLDAACPGVRSKIDIVPPFPILTTADGQPLTHRRELRARYGIPEDAFVFVYFGYVYPGKGLDVLIQALQRLVKAERPAFLVTVGGTIATQYSNWTTYGDCLRHLAWALGVERRIIWAGGYSHRSDEASRWLHAADAAVMPFDVGIGLNNSSIAATTLHGLPLISTQSKELDEAFVPEHNVILCPPRDAAALAAAMDRVMMDGELFARLRDGASALHRVHFSRSAALDRIAQILTGNGKLTEAKPAADEPSAEGRAAARVA